jgi:prephenate dehydrogenase
MFRSYTGVRKSLRFSKSNRILSSRKLAIIGGTGRMGRVLVRMMKLLDYTITIYSRSKQKALRIASQLDVEGDVLDIVMDQEIVIVSVPIEVTPKICLKIAEKMKPNSLLVDISAVKSPIIPIILSSLPKRLEYLSIHPLFGPQVRKFRGENLLAVKATSGPLSETFLHNLNYLGLNVTTLSAFEHDKIMAAYQVIHHYSLISLSVALEEQLHNSVLDPKLYTRSYRSTLQLIQKLKKNIQVILEIQKLNPEAKKARKEFLTTAYQLSEINDKSAERIIKALQILTQNDSF